VTRYGYFLSSEEYDPAELVRQAKLAEAAGFEALWISDHFHPWLDDQGQSSFVWSVIGAISQVTSVGGAPEEFFEFYAEQVLPKARGN
jgi:alkanesulfonate monooxygenase SsuD/methylene tetrahydromethanopterin reductase-like flavin-dependent oxidoreductase (luciferase family)